MTAKEPERADPESRIGLQTVSQLSELDDVERELVSQRLDRLGSRLSIDLRDLSETVENGDEVTADEVEAVSDSLRRLADTIDRHLTEAQTPEELTIEQRWYETDNPVPGRVDDADHLVGAPAVEVSHLLNSDLRRIRRVAQVVDHNLLGGSLTDYHVSILWDAGDRLTAWATDVLNHRLDDYVLLDDRSRLSEEQRQRLGLVDGDRKTDDPEEIFGGAPLGYE